MNNTTQVAEVHPPYNYTLIAYRYGHRDGHSYVFDMCNAIDTAKEIAEKEVTERGGKYSVVVFAKHEKSGIIEEMYEAKCPEHYTRGTVVNKEKEIPVNIHLWDTCIHAAMAKAKLGSIVYGTEEVKNVLRELKLLKVNTPLKNNEASHNKMADTVEFVENRDVLDGWVRVGDEGQMPDENQLVDVFTSISVEPSVYMRGEFYRYPNEIEGDICSLYYFDKTKVTHWRERPAKPQQL